jgi:hypothetical protein
MGAAETALERCPTFGFENRKKNSQIMNEDNCLHVLPAVYFMGLVIKLSIFRLCKKYKTFAFASCKNNKLG